MTHLALSDELLDAQLLRTAGVALAGGSDLGECLATASRINGTNFDSWYDEWTATAETLLLLASHEADSGQAVTARLAFFRASSYFRTAGVMLLGLPGDDRAAECNRRQTDAFRRGAALLDTDVEVIEIGYEETTLPGYFFRPAGAVRPRATVILTGGYDGTSEELYFLTGAAALERGYNVLSFDGPGQGAALLQQHLVLRPEWEEVITPVVDYLVTRSDTDPGRIALIGLSLGAHLAPRAASAEHRLAALIADCGSFDLFDAALGRMPPPLRRGFTDGQRVATAVLAKILDLMARKPTVGWALRRGQLVHGVSSPLAYLSALREYSLRGRAGSITCPTFLCNAEDDDIGASAPELAAALSCPYEFVTFSSADGAGDHCEAGARALFHARAFGWLDAHLEPAA